MIELCSLEKIKAPQTLGPASSLLAMFHVHTIKQVILVAAAFSYTFSLHLLLVCVCECRAENHPICLSIPEVEQRWWISNQTLLSYHVQ